MGRRQKLKRLAAGHRRVAFRIHLDRLEKRREWRRRAVARRTQAQRLRAQREHGALAA